MIRRIYATVTLVLTLLAVALFARDAEAGSWRLKNNEIQEVSGGWHLYLSVDLNAPPPLPHIPMKFMFTKLVVYERALVDNQKDPVINRTVLTGQMPQIITQDVDFSDASGKVYKGTRFDFSITRTVGFEAGEYKVQLRTSDGTDVGGPVNVTLKGDNPVVDRRSMTFNAKDPSVKKIAGVDAGTQVASNDDTPSAAVPSNGDVTPVGSAQPFIPADAYKKTPEEGGEIQDHPKGCGCSVLGESTSKLGWLALPALAGLVVMRRRRRA